MKSLKTLGVVAVLTAAAGGVYVSLHRPPQFPASVSPQQAADGGESAFQSGKPPSPGPSAGGPDAPFGGVNVSLGAGLSSQEALSLPTQPASEASSERQSVTGNAPAQSLAAERGPADPAPVQEGQPVAVQSAPAQWRPDWPGLSSSNPQPSTGELPAAPAGTASQEASSRTKVDFATFMTQVNQLLARGQLASALEQLSQRYDDPSLKPEEYAQVVDLLDQIAYAVIYSPESVLEPPYVVQPGDTLQRIAQSYGVPWQLLARINGIADPNSLTPGQKLKVVRGPFDAEVDLKRREMTLKLHGLYAGRFSLPKIVAPERLESTYFVEDKSSVPGQWWIRLSRGAEIRGEAEVSPVRTGGEGAPVLHVEADQIENLHTILSVGSRVRILR
ncbi:MAG: LysM peptidoglycan-binding domain-containing protein [Thermoguttaceae bacterium]|nr:LysM peptidoglycan-binding domain-containing protein [Thermoguttaceae bacterium]MDW8077969.1 LysM peptidoglycan-binding domain-containing protein [Thermoguttaceae bacterium]